MSLMGLSDNTIGHCKSDHILLSLVNRTTSGQLVTSGELHPVVKITSPQFVYPFVRGPSVL